MHLVQHEVTAHDLMVGQEGREQTELLVLEEAEAEGQDIILELEGQEGLGVISQIIQHLVGMGETHEQTEGMEGLGVLLLICIETEGMVEIDMLQEAYEEPDEDILVLVVRLEHEVQEEML